MILIEKTKRQKQQECSDSFSRAAAECVKMAAEKGTICYLYKRDGKGFWGLSYQYWRGYLFKAYPGGRKILTVEGREYLKEYAPQAWEKMSGE